MVLLTSVSSLIIWFKLGCLINMSVWSSAFIAINTAQEREAEREISFYCIQLAAIKAKPSKWSLFNIQLISSTVRYWQDFLGLLVQFACLFAKGLLCCSVNSFNSVLAGQAGSHEILEVVPNASLSSILAGNKADHKH